MNDNVWFISDLHFYHKNIIKYCDRPWTFDEQNDKIFDMLNDELDSDSIVYHMGDLTGHKISFSKMESIFKRLIGKWHFILGNHDIDNQLKELCKKYGHVYLGMYHDVTINDKRMIMFHYPIESWHGKGRGAYHLHGHVHNIEMRYIKNRYNVCLDYTHKLTNINDII